MASFQGAIMVEADFSGADLSFSDFSHANLTGALFQGAILKRSNLHRVQEAGSNFGGSGRSFAKETDIELSEAEDFTPRRISE
jgi:uncharacterized protein YjbI with pentapeptide repeats